MGLASSLPSDAHEVPPIGSLLTLVCSVCRDALSRMGRSLTFSRKKGTKATHARSKPSGSSGARPAGDAASDSGSVSTRSNCSARGVVKWRAAGAAGRKPLSRGRAVTIGDVLAEAISKHASDTASKAASKATAAQPRRKRDKAHGDMEVEGLASWGQQASEEEEAAGAIAADDDLAEITEMEDADQHGERPASAMAAAPEAAPDSSDEEGAHAPPPPTPPPPAPPSIPFSTSTYVYTTLPFIMQCHVR